MFSEESDIKGSAEMVAAARTYVSTMDGIQTTKKRVMWDASAGPPAMKLFPLLVAPSLSNCFKNLSQFKMGRHVTDVKWSGLWQRRLYGMGEKTMPAVGCGVLGAPLKKSQIDHGQRGSRYSALGSLKWEMLLGTTLSGCYSRK